MDIKSKDNKGYSERGSLVFFFEDFELVGFLLQLRLTLSESALNLATDVAVLLSFTITLIFTQTYPRFSSLLIIVIEFYDIKNYAL